MLSLFNHVASPLLSKIAAVWRFLQKDVTATEFGRNVSLTKPWGEVRLSCRLRGSRVGELRPAAAERKVFV